MTRRELAVAYLRLTRTRRLEIMHQLGVLDDDYLDADDSEIDMLARVRERGQIEQLEAILDPDRPDWTPQDRNDLPPWVEDDARKKDL